MMEYVIADRDDADAYWFERSIPTIDMAIEKAKSYPDAKYILEYRYDPLTRGVLPTTRSWKIWK